MYHDLKRRLLQNIGINVFAQLVNVLIQLVSIPLFLRFWGIQLYGEWLILYTIPSYFSMSDLGFASVAVNEMTMLVARGEKNQAIEVFQSTLALISTISVLLLALITSIAWMFPLENWLNIQHQSHETVFIIITALTVYVLIGLELGLLSAGFQCDGHYVLGGFLSNILRLFEYSVALSLVFYSGSPSNIAVAFLLVRLLGYISMYIILRRLSPWITLEFHHAKLSVIRQLTKPAISYMLFPIGTGLSNQGIITIISVVLGPTSVVIFSTLRTLSRLVLQVMNVIAQGVWNEMSKAYGSGDIALVRILHRKSFKLSFWLSAILLIMLLSFGSWIVRIWTQGKVEVDHFLLAIMLLVMLVNSLWFTSSCVLASTNNHQVMSYYFIGAASLSFLSAIILTQALGLRGTAVSLLFSELIMMGYVVRASLNLIQDDLLPFLRNIFSPPSSIKLFLR